MENNNDFLNKTNENVCLSENSPCEESEDLEEKTKKLLQKLKVPSKIVKKLDKPNKILEKEDIDKKNALREQRIENLKKYREKINALKQNLNGSVKSNVEQEKIEKNENITHNDIEKPVEKPLILTEEKKVPKKVNANDVNTELQEKQKELDNKKNNLKSKMVLDEEIKERLDKKMKMNHNKNLKKKISIKYYGDVSEQEMENDKLMLEREQNKDLEMEKMKYQQEQEKIKEKRASQLKNIQNSLFNY